MRSIQFGIIIGATLCGLLWVALSSTAQWASAQTIPLDTPTPTAPVSAAQDDTLVLTATVGIDPNTCGVTDTIEVRANTPVYHCFTVHNLGAVTLITHVVSSTIRAAGNIAPVVWGNRPITPNVVVSTVSYNLTFADSTSRDVTNVITWTARAADVATLVTAIDVVTIDIVGPAVSLIKTVGQDPNRCATATELRIPSGTDAYYCLTLVNTGDTLLTRHTVNDPQLGITHRIFDVPLNPNEQLVITHNTPQNQGIPALHRSNITARMVNTASVTSVAAGGEASASASALLDVGTTTVQFAKTVGRDPDACPSTTSVIVPRGARLYYCVTIRNTGATTLTHHVLREEPLSIDLRFDYLLPPKEVLTLTNSVLEDLNQPVVFGPFEFSDDFPSVVNNRMAYTGTGITASGTPVTVTANGSTSASFATRTPTPRPSSPDTPTPFPTSTPTVTPLPPTPTDTPTPTFTPVTPSPTPTRSYAISILETPTPAQPVGDPTAFVDPAMLALTAEAATATAAAFSPLPTPDVPFSPLATPDQAMPGPVSPLSTPSPTPTLPLTPTPDETPTLAAIVIVVTDTPAPEGAQLPPGQRPIVPPTPTPTPDYVMFAATMIDSFLLTTGWIWFFAGSLIFFVSAGIVAGLFFRQQEGRRFDLVEGDLEDGALAADAIPPAPGDERRRSEPDDWPDSLP